MGTRAIIVIDLQNEYLPSGKLPLTGIAEAVSNAARVIAEARTRGEAVVHVRHEAASAGAPFFVPDSPGVAIIAELRPQDGEQLVVKNFPNSFRKTRLKSILDEKEVDNLIIVGAMSHMCIEATTRAAADLGGYSITVIHDACATRDLEFDGDVVPANQVHAASMAALAFGYATITSTDDWLTSK